MITAQELRQGNYVTYDGRYFQIDVIASEIPTLNTPEFGIGAVDWNNLHPIPLTEEILLKCGFETNLLDNNNPDDGVYYTLRLSNDKYCDLSLISGDNNGIFEVYLFPYENIRFKYLHQVQNIYQSITGKELEVNL